MNSSMAQASKGKKDQNQASNVFVVPFEPKEIAIRTEKINLYYAHAHALKDVTMEIPRCSITAIIGPSGCGKSSLLRIFNRMNDLIPIARVEGKMFLDDVSVYDKTTDVVELRQKIGMVFQKPNPFPMSIYDNITMGPKHHGYKTKQELDEIVEYSLQLVHLWDEVKDDLRKHRFNLSPEQQQRLCIARTLACQPEIILMDESCSALDPISTAKIEELMLELAKDYAIIIVTHNMEQAHRVSDMSAFMMIDENKAGNLVEYAPTKIMFTSPKDKRTQDYIEGRFG